MAISDNREPQYLHGADAGEQARLEAMVTILGGVEFLPALTPGMRILDVGCGTGSIARRVAAKVAPGEVVGVDMQQDQLTTAKTLAEQHDIKNLTFKHDEAGRLDFGNSEFDGAYCRFLLEHVSSPVDVVREMARVVKPGGWVCAFEWENGCSVVHPDCPAVRRVWQALYDLQADMGGDPAIARKLFEIFTRAVLSEVKADGRAWSMTAKEKDKLRVYVDGAREIISQGRDGLLSQTRVTEDLLAQADEEYERLLAHPATFVIEGHVRATGIKPV